LFPSTLVRLGEQVESVPFIQILGKLEKLGILTSKEEWQRLRNIRNQLTHDYTDDPTEACRQLNALFEAEKSLLRLFQSFENYLTSFLS